MSTLMAEREDQPFRAAQPNNSKPLAVIQLRATRTAIRSISTNLTHQIRAPACMVIKTPMPNTTNALTAGSQRLKPDTRGTRASSPPPLINSSPTVMSTPARPRLNTVTRTMPKPTRPKEIAVNSNINAAGQGSRPPDMPNPNRARQVTCVSSAPGGRWE